MMTITRNSRIYSKEAVVDEKRFVALEEVLTKYLQNHPTATGWAISRDRGKGVIATNWYRAHKGEVRLKCMISVNRGLIRVDVWQKVGFIFPKILKTDLSRREEWALEQGIEKRLP